MRFYIFFSETILIKNVHAVNGINSNVPIGFTVMCFYWVWVCGDNHFIDERF